MPRRKLRLEPNEQEQKALAEIKRIHAEGGRKLTPAQARKLLKRARVLELPGFKPGCKVRYRDGKAQYKPMGFGRWRDHSPAAYFFAKAERDYLTALENAKVPRVSGGAASRKEQGDATRRRVLREWEACPLPEHDRAAAIARRLGLSARQVRRHLK